jgi:hypothetical protein
MMRTSVVFSGFRALWGYWCVLGLAAALGGMVFLAGCGNELEDVGDSDTVLIVQSIVGDSDNFIFSDVLDSESKVHNDNAAVTLAAELKSPDASPGTAGYTDVLVTDYRVDYFRVDGTPSDPGVTVPYPFQGQLQLVVPAGGNASTAFVIVRHEIKLAPPIIELAGGGGEGLIIVTAQCTFWGRDQMGAGDQVSAVGFIEIHFADFPN